MKHAMRFHSVIFPSRRREVQISPLERRQTEERPAIQSEVCPQTRHGLLCTMCCRRLPLSTSNTPLGGMKHAVRFHSVLFPSRRREVQISPLVRRQTEERPAIQSEVCPQTRHGLLCTMCCRRLPLSTSNTPLGGMKHAVLFHSVLFPSRRREVQISPLERRQTEERPAIQSEVCPQTRHGLLCTMCCRRLPLSTSNTPLGGMKHAVLFHSVLFPSRRREVQISPLERRQTEE